MAACGVQSQTVTGIVLAGGRSHRMGRDKAREPIGGQTSLARIVEALRAVVGEVLVVGGANRAAVPDIAPFGGPLQALVAAGRALRGGPAVVLPCDVPFISQALIAALALPLPPSIDARILRLAGRAQPLVAHYGASAWPTLEHVWTAGSAAVDDRRR